MPNEKLVRDKIPDIIRQKGANPRTRTASIDEFDEMLRRKLVEEASEFLISGEIEEIADMMEVICSLLKVRGADLNTVEELRVTKRNERGGFRDRVILDMDSLE